VKSCWPRCCTSSPTSTTVPACGPAPSAADRPLQAPAGHAGQDRPA
jgi:hypothetical protein